MPPDIQATRVSSAWRATPPRVYRAALLAAACTALAVTAIIGVAAGGWIGTSFPGFFVLPNRIIPSVSRSGWSGSTDSTIYQRTVIAVDGKRIVDNVDAYREVATHAPGTAVQYTLQHGSTIETSLEQTPLTSVL